MILVINSDLTYNQTVHVLFSYLKKKKPRKIDTDEVDGNKISIEGGNDQINPKNKFEKEYIQIQDKQGN